MRQAPRKSTRRAALSGDARQVALTIRIDFGAFGYLGPGKIALMELISKHGSISAAGKEMGMSYRRAWLLVDEIIQGPFRVFVHEHRFEPDGTRGCLMTDVVTYAFGRGWWGRLLSRTAVRAYLHGLFAYRHWRTRAWAARQTASTPP